MNMNPRTRIALIIGLSVLLVVALGFALIYPQITKASKLETQQIKAEQDLLKMRQVLAERTALSKKEAELKEEQARLESRVPQNAELSTVIRRLQDLAFENEHWLFDLNNSDPVKTEGVAYNTWEARYTIEGSWKNTLDYLKELRDMDRQVRVKQIVFQRAIDLHGGSQIPPRVIKHWNLGAYPVRTQITCDIYFISDDAVKEEMEKRKSAESGDAETAPEDADTEGGEQ